MAKKKSKNNSRSKATAGPRPTAVATVPSSSDTTSTTAAASTMTKGDHDSEAKSVATSRALPSGGTIYDAAALADSNTDTVNQTLHQQSALPRQPDCHQSNELNLKHQDKRAEPPYRQETEENGNQNNSGDNSSNRAIAAKDHSSDSHLLPIEHGPPRRYEDDNDDDDHLHTERTPLIRTGSQESVGYNSDGGSQQYRLQGQLGSPIYAVRDSDNNPPATWLEWALSSGLHPRTWNRQTYIKAGLLVTLLTLIILSMTVFRIQDHIKDVLRYIDNHKRIGAVLFILSYTVACTLFLPGSLFTIGAGFLFKPFPLALLIVLLGDIFAAVGSFIFGRYVFYDWVKSVMSKHPKFNALDQVIKDDGWKIVVMLRLTPIPFNLITYFFSITSIRLWTVVWATCIGVFPGSCIGIWIGSLLKGLSGIDNPELATKNLVILVMNGVFIVCCILTLSIFGKRSLRKAMKRLEQHQALTNLQEVEIVVEGVASVIREMEDNASVPPSLRSTMIEQLAAEEDDQDHYYRGDLESAERRLLRPSKVRTRDADEETEGEGGECSSGITTLTSHHENGRSKAVHHPLPSTAASLPSSGFTKGEKITFAVIALVAVLNVCVCVPLYYHFADQDD